jgi:hypothetical protein
MFLVSFTFMLVFVLLMVLAFIGVDWFSLGFRSEPRSMLPQRSLVFDHSESLLFRLISNTAGVSSLCVGLLPGGGD